VPGHTNAVTNRGWPAQTANRSGVRLGRHISTLQVFESNTKIAKLASFCQIDFEGRNREIGVIALEAWIERLRARSTGYGG
jgi:hypothetical protein